MNNDIMIIALLTGGILVWVCYELIRRGNREAEMVLQDSNNEVSDDTRSALGESAYATMTEHVADIMRRHSHDRCIAVSLTSGATEGEASDELHHLLPGDPLWLKPSDEEGVSKVEVYSGGYRIGELLLLDAEAALEVLRNSSVKGTYVCEQNCYEYYEKVSLRIIMFYGEKEAAKEECPEVSDMELQSMALQPYKITYDEGPVSITVFQN